MTVKSGETYSSALGPVISEYLALKQALGRQYFLEEHIFRALDAFLAQCVDEGQDLDANTYGAWCLSLEHLAPGVRRNRMRLVRNLCLYRRRTEPSSFVPDSKLFPPPHCPVRPYIFPRREIAQLIKATRRLPINARYPLRRNLFRIVIVLLYTTGLRLGELLRLTLADYDPVEGTLFVRVTKFHKSRLLPLSPDGLCEMKRYLRARHRHRPACSIQEPLLLSEVAKARGYTGAGLRYGVRHLFRIVGVRKADGRFPRIHDFRHTFAVQALLRWYRAGVDVQAKLPMLATYLGHVSISSTERYLPFVEAVAAEANARFAQAYGGLVIPPSDSLRGGS